MSTIRNPAALVISLAIFGVPTAPAGASAAATFTVNSTADAPDATLNGVCAAASGACTLRAAVMEANFVAGEDTIVLPAGEYHLTGNGDDTAASGDLDVVASVSIVGAGAATTIVDADSNDRVFHIHVAGTQLTLTGLTVADGRAVGGFGGGIDALPDTRLTLSDGALRDSKADLAGGGIFANSGSTISILRSTIGGNRALNGNGGGVNLQGGVSVTIDRSTVSGNLASLEGGGIYGGSGGTIDIVNTTVSGNLANSHGGGILLHGAATLNNLTVTGNRADDDGSGNGDGGGVVWPSFGTTKLQNTIVAGNFDDSPGAEAPDCTGGLTSSGYNLVGSNSGCSFPATTGDIVGANPNLGPLAANGGPTQTHALLPGSPAIDAGNPAAVGTGGSACAAVDQRGVPRPHGSRCDIGAYELADCQGLLVTIVGSDLADTLLGTAAADGILALGGADEIDAKEGNDAICGGDGDDTVTGGPGDDVVAAGSGNDRVVEIANTSFTLTPASLTGVGTDTLMSVELATLTGGPGNNVLDASSFGGAVTLRGEAGDDLLQPGRGSDTLDGGLGTDTVADEGNVDFRLTNSQLKGRGTDALSSIEQAALVGGASANTIDARGFTGRLVAAGRGGADRIIGGRRADVLGGNGGRDRLSGGRGRDRLNGGKGPDRLAGGKGADRLNGGKGADRLAGGKGADRLNGGRGRDLCIGGPGRDRLRACERGA